MKLLAYLSLLLFLGMMSCADEIPQADAYGSFEAQEVLVSAEASGKLLQFEVSAGQELAAGDLVGYVDSTQLVLKKRQLQSSIAAILSRRQNLDAQSKVFEEQKANLERELKRLEAMLADGAATTQQVDEIKGQLDLVESQRLARLSTLQISNQSLRREVAPLQAQIAQINDQIHKCQIRNPIQGRVLQTYARAQEITAFARPLYKLADLRELDLRVYVSAPQLEKLQLGQGVEVRIDQGERDYETLPGKVVWISDQAEFTPKSVQTHEARVRLVYAVRVAVPNPGHLRIGMPGEIMLASTVAAPETAYSSKSQAL